MNEVLNALKQRRSCRKYLDKQVDAAHLDAILEAGFIIITCLLFKSLNAV